MLVVDLSFFDTVGMAFIELLRQECSGLSLLCFGARASAPPPPSGSSAEQVVAQIDDN